MRADFGSLGSERTHVTAALKKKQISKEDAQSRHGLLRYAFGERDPISASGERLPTLGLMGRQPVANTVEMKLIGWLGTLLFAGILDKTWAFGVVSPDCRKYAGAAARTHARFGKRLVLMYLAAGFVVVCIEVYGFTKGGQAFDGTATCEPQLAEMCKAQVCVDAVCPNLLTLAG